MKKLDDKHFQTRKQLIQKSHHSSMVGSFREQRPVCLKYSKQEGTIRKLGQTGGQNSEHSSRCQFHVFKVSSKN